ncbi:hypothetical protein HK104_004422, partial [Borealophlyctis nickersoniae]
MDDEDPFEDDMEALRYLEQEHEKEKEKAVEDIFTSKPLLPKGRRGPLLFDDTDEEDEGAPPPKKPDQPTPVPSDWTIIQKKKNYPHFGMEHSQMTALSLEDSSDDDDEGGEAQKGGGRKGIQSVMMFDDDDEEEEEDVGKQFLKPLGGDGTTQTSVEGSKGETSGDIGERDAADDRSGDDGHLNAGMGRKRHPEDDGDSNGDARKRRMLERSDTTGASGDEEVSRPETVSPEEAARLEEKRKGKRPRATDDLDLLAAESDALAAGTAPRAKRAHEDEPSQRLFDDDDDDDDELFDLTVPGGPMFPNRLDTRRHENHDNTTLKRIRPSVDYDRIPIFAQTGEDAPLEYPESPPRPSSRPTATTINKSGAKPAPHPSHRDSTATNHKPTLKPTSSRSEDATLKTLARRYT